MRTSGASCRATGFLRNGRYWRRGFARGPGVKAWIFFTTGFNELRWAGLNRQGGGPDPAPDRLLNEMFRNLLSVDHNAAALHQGAVAAQRRGVIRAVLVADRCTGLSTDLWSQRYNKWTGVSRGA